MGISSPGIGSNLDVNGIISKLMAVEAAPVASIDKKSASYLAKVTAFGTLSGALSTFQSSLSSLTSLSSFQAFTATSSNSDILSGTATSKAQAGTYKVDISQVAQAQTLASGGYSKPTSTIGLGGKTTINISLGTVAGGSFGLTGAALGTGVLTGGITPGALSINNTAIATDSGTRSAKLLADAINAKSATTGVSAKAEATRTAETLFGAAGATSYGAVDTSGGGTYSLSIAGVEIASQAAGVAAGAGVDAAAIDSVLGGSNSVTQALANANITFSGSAADGTLRFSNADGSNIAVVETVSGGVTGGIGNSGTANTGYSSTATSSVSLLSSTGTQITVGGSNPAAAGLTAGLGGTYQGAAFTQDGSRSSGNIVIDSTNNTLQGIRDAINKANFGVTASIISDGSATNPNHLVLTSSATGANSNMRITVSGSGGDPADAAIEALLAYDPGGVQNLSQKTAAQDTLANVNGIAVTSHSTSISGAVEGLTFAAQKVGSASLTVAKDTATLTSSINGFVKAYNELSTQIKSVSGYDPETKQAGQLLGDSTVQNLQASLRRQLTGSISGLSGSKLTTLSQVGIAFQKDGTLTLDSAKLQKAITNNFGDIAGLFAAVGRSTDAEVSFTGSTSATKAGDYLVQVTRLASQGTLTSAAALPGSTTIADDTVWTVKLNDSVPTTSSNTASIRLTAGTYTPQDLATLLQASINGASNFKDAGSTVEVTVNDDGTLKVNSTKYGSKSNIALTSDTGTSVASIFGGATATDGVDVAGTIGGFSATGDGQTLTGGPGAPVEGLKLEVKGDTLGSRGTIGFSQGYAYQMDTLAKSFLGANGIITGRTKGMNDTVKDLAKQKDAFNAKLVDIEARYRKQYSALDTALSSMSTTAAFLTQQFAKMNA
ncbi:flagellar filament capping protein FliD [Pseudoduganella namucuonensis]|uniref:Flagellar hook-associated protein 2 n=1 Tax=Pseudoduganella namucuonensis TaxID=1035707 RepID=A0A1I7KZJ4_9BURK|nr:flagellar filament capping protein FliD [Pseudoduganella namucuonensis]SFV02867.1 flagellar hook-associated protein 2 [Pseudoduganella namucuonensis]